MIYIFEGQNNSASVVYDGLTLTTKQKNAAIKVEVLPEPETPDGMQPMLKASKETGQVWYEYIPAEPDPIRPEQKSLEQQVAELQAQNNEIQRQNLVLMDALATIYEELLVKEVV
jgi:hypothetical protein